MAKTMIIPGRGCVKVDNSLGCGKIYTNDEKPERKQSQYDRLKAQVYATGNKWAIENFHATHD